MTRLVVFAPNWLGDAVMALPAIADLRRASPNASLTIAARPAIVPLFGMVPGIDEILVLEKRGRVSFLGKPGSFSGRNNAENESRNSSEKETRPLFDVAILLPNSFHAALMAWRANVPERWGYRTDWRRALLTRAIAPPSGQVHQVEYYQRLVSELGFPNGSGQPSIPMSRELGETGARELKEAGWDGRSPLVALAPGSAYGGAKRWPPASFAGLARELADDGVQSVMVGSRADLPVAREIESALGGRTALNLMGTDLPTLAAVLATCRVLVSNDSGAMHLGAALGVPVTTVFGPTDERVTRPVGDAHVVLTTPVWCRPCLMRECPIDHRCMRGVGVDRVAGAVRQML